MDEAALGKRLQLARKRAGLTQQELCQKAGLSYSTLAKIERGAIKSPSVFTVASIAAVTTTPLEELLDMEARKAGAPTPSTTKKRSKTGVTFVYFDVNGTIVRFFERAFTAIAKLSGHSPEAVETLYWRNDDAGCRGAMTIQQLNKIFAKELNMPDFEWQKYYLENVEPTPHISELLEWAAEYYDVGLLTNNWPGLTDALIAKKLVPAVDYKVVLDSAKVGYVKPNPKIYELAQDLSGVAADEILLVDDVHSYLIPADKIGWQILRFDGFQPDESIARVKKVLEF